MDGSDRSVRLISGYSCMYMTGAQRKIEIASQHELLPPLAYLVIGATRSYFNLYELLFGSPARGLLFKSLAYYYTKLRFMDFRFIFLIFSGVERFGDKILLPTRLLVRAEACRSLGRSPD